MSSVLFRIHSKELADGLHYQHQAILRNTSSGATASGQFMRTGWAWRNTGTKSPIYRSLGYSALAIFTVLAFTVAGVFSSWVTSSTSEVLLQASAYCGDFELYGRFGYSKNTTPLSDQYVNTVAAIQGGFHSDMTHQASSYAQQCSALQKSQSGYCSPIARREIAWTSTVSSDCPFGDNICINGSLHMDSGMIDSLLDLGINSRTEDRIGFRLVYKCAPIKTVGYRSGWLNASDPLITSLDLPQGFDTNSSSLLFYYGPNLAASGNVNFTYLYTKNAANYSYFSTLGSYTETSGFLLELVL
jgi:hypothetical protein